MGNRVMEEFEIDEMSMVDSPAQKGAVAVLLKRDASADPEEETPDSSEPGDEEDADGAPSEKRDDDVEYEDEDDDMTDKAKAQKADEGADRIAALEAQVAKANALASMTDAQRAHYAKLDGDAAATFLKADEQGRSDAIEAANKTDRVVFKSADGTEFRESDDARLVAMAKRADAEAAESAKLRDDLAKRDLEKRAEAELGNLPGEVSVRAALLKAVESIPDEETRKGAMTALKAQDAGLAKAFEAAGVVVRTEPIAKAEDRLDQLTADYAKQHNVSEAEALLEVLKTSEGVSLYDQATAVAG